MRFSSASAIVILSGDTGIVGLSTVPVYNRAAPAIAETFDRHGISLSFGPFFRWWLVGKLRAKLGVRGPLLRAAAFALRSRRLTGLLGESYHWRVTGTKRSES